MALNFPNQSRSFDESARRVRFWGHDGAMEIEFVIELAAIVSLRPNTANIDVQILAAFDAARVRITEAAGKVYARHRRMSFCVLTASDF